ncbi:MAG: hypothetical protein M3M96_00550 [Candidatus Eremiobacteraeota bacterium]|nr:hypothetical protein [Candidatus Eremiobacteraeota bacterium]
MTNSALARTPLSASETSKAIDASISGNDRDLLLSVISKSSIRGKLADTAHPVVVVLYDAKANRFISNRVGIGAAFEALDPIPGTGNLYRSRNGHEFAGPGIQPRPGAMQSEATSSKSRGIRDYYPIVDRGTGPYRRLYSQPNSFETGTPDAQTLNEVTDVTLPPCGSSQYAANTRDAGYIYLGGWGSFGFSVDAGVYHTLRVNGSDAYQQFMSINGHFLQTNEDIIGQSQLGFRSWPCGQGIAMQFETGTYTQDGYTVTVLLGVNQHYIGYVDNGATMRAWGWTPVCTGCVLKRMTSISQSPENLTDGSKFGPVLWQVATINCDVGSLGCTQQMNWSGAQAGFPEPYNGSRWNYPEIGGCMEYPQWNPSGSPGAYPQDCNGTPGAGGPYAVQVSWQDNADETDRIVLTSNVPPAPTPAPTRAPQGGGGGCGKNNCL